MCAHFRSYFEFVPRLLRTRGFCIFLLLLFLASAGVARAQNNAQFLSQSVPSSMVAGQSYSVSVTMKNTGSSTWTSGGTTPHSLGSQNPQDNGIWDSGRIALPGSVAPGDTVTFSWNVTAPATAGTYNFQKRMVQDGVGWFGEFTPNVAVMVTSGGGGQPGNHAQFVSQSVLSTMTAGQSYSVSVTMKNTGDTTWTSAGQYALGSQNPQDNNTWDSGRIALPGSVAPGQEVTFSWSVTAPSTPGAYNFQKRMIQEGVEWFGDLTPNVAVTVTQGGGGSPPSPAPDSLTATAVSSSQINLVWNDPTVGEIGFKVERKTGTGGTWSEIGATPNSSYSDTGLSASTNYVYRVRAYNSAGNSGYSNEASATTSPGGQPGNHAQFLSQSVPGIMVAGQSYSVSVTMKNTGDTTWTPDGTTPYKLGSQNPDFNHTWGDDTVPLPGPVTPGQEVTFSWSVTAPTVIGRYNFQWRMFQHTIELFGEATSNVEVEVTPSGSGGGGGTPLADVPAPGWAEDVLPLDAFEADGFGPSSADAVNLASGVYENRPGPDIVVRNPVGPDAEFTRLYRSARAANGYASPGLSAGWMHSYDVTIQGGGVNVASTPGTGASALTLIYPNGAQEALLDGAGNLQAPAGAPYLVSGESAASAGRWNWIQLTFTDETKWIFRPTGSNPDRYVLVQIANQQGQSLWMDYQDGAALLSIQNDAGATLLSFGYAGGWLSTATDIYGRQVHFTFGAAAGTTCLTAVSQIDSTQVQWQYGYTAIGGQPFLNSVAVPNPAGSGLMSHPINYDPGSGFVTSLEDANGNQRVYTYNGSTTRIDTFDAGNLNAPLESWTQKIGASNVDTGTTDAAGNSTAVGGYQNTYQPTSLANENGQSSQVEYVPGHPYNVWRTTSPRGLITTYTYDYTFPLGRLSSVKVGGKTETKFLYYPDGRLQHVDTPTPGTSGAASWVRTTYEYTSLGNVWKVHLPGNNAASVRTYTYGYDVVNDPVDGYTKSEALGEPVSVTDPLGHVTRYRYDAKGNLTGVIEQVTATDFLRTDFTYNGADQLEEVIYPATGQGGPERARTQYVYRYLGGPLQYTRIYDESGQLFRQVDHGLGAEGEGKSQTGSVPTVQLGYDGRYRVTAIADGKNQTTTHSFDPVGNLKEMVFPGGGSDRIQWPGFSEGGHDAAGNVLRRIDGNNQVTRYQRATGPNEDSRLTGITYDNQPAQNVSFLYDEYNRVTQMTDGTGVTIWAYDDLNNITSMTRSFTGGPQNQQIAYSYYPDGSRQSMTTPAGPFSYSYDADGRLVTLTNPFTDGVRPNGQTFAWTYLDNHWIKTQKLGNGYFTGAQGTLTTYTYDARGNVIRLVNQDVYSNTLLSEFKDISYDAVGNCLTITSDLVGFSSLSKIKNYAYDTKDQILQEQWTSSNGSTSTANYNYDDAGNLFGSSAWTYNVKNQLTNAPGWGAFAYDDNGNPTTYRDATLTFDAENRLTAHGTSTYAGYMNAGYQGDGLRAWRQTWMGTTYFLYDGTVPVMELSSDEGLQAVTTFGANGLLSRRAGPANAYNDIFYTFDPQGNCAERLDDLGRVITAYLHRSYGINSYVNGSDYQYTPFRGIRYDPYGGGYLDGSNAGGIKAQWGYYTDHVTNLLLCTYRYYDPSMGRFLTRDPIGYGGGINLYAYTENNPVNRIDPDGLDSANVTRQDFQDAALMRLDGVPEGQIAAEFRARQARRAEYQQRSFENGITGISLLLTAGEFAGVARGVVAGGRALLIAHADRALARRFALETTGSLQRMVSGSNTLLREKVWGIGSEGATKALRIAERAKSYRLPEGLTRETLLAYKEVIRRNITSRLSQKGGLPVDDVGLVRTKLINLILKKSRFY